MAAPASRSHVAEGTEVSKTAGLHQYVPPQHGAWAFLGLPVLLALTVTPWSWLIVVLTLAWVLAYPWSYAALGLVRAKRPARFRRPFMVFSIALVPLVVALMVARPWLLWAGLGLMLLFAVNVAYARRNDERSLVNDGVLIVECAAMVPITWAVAVGGQSFTAPSLVSVPTEIWVLTVLCALVLVGSTLHVKSLIRERRDPRYAAASRIVAVASVGAAVGLALWWGVPGGWWLVVPFVLLAVRAFVVGRRPLRPGVIGMIELAAFVVAVLAAVLAAA
jgi:hypothetical protein